MSLGEFQDAAMAWDDETEEEIPPYLLVANQHLAEDPVQRPFPSRREEARRIVDSLPYEDEEKTKEMLRAWAKAVADDICPSIFTNKACLLKRSPEKLNRKL